MKKELPFTYYEYKKALLDFVVLNGNSTLSERQIQQFIDQNDLYSRFGITRAEVMKDISSILGPNMFGSKIPPVYDLPEYQLDLKKELLPIAREGLSDFEIAQFIKSKSYLNNYRSRMEVEDVRIHLERLVNGKWIQTLATPSQLFQTNKVYQNALRLRLRDNNNEPLSETSIKVFIKRGGFDKSCGLDVATVKRDMFAIPNKYNVYVLKTMDVFSENSKHTPSSQIHTTRTQDETKSKNHSSVRASSHETLQLMSIDTQLCSVVSEALIRYRDLLLDRKRLAGLLKDICPNQRREVNILLQIYDLGIIEELQKQKEINELFIQRFVNRAVNEYGTSESLAKAMVAVWCVCYGQNICNIKCDI